MDFRGQLFVAELESNQIALFREDRPRFGATFVMTDSPADRGGLLIYAVGTPFNNYQPTPTQQQTATKALRYFRIVLNVSISTGLTR
jgi:hypothetical protein